MKSKIDLLKRALLVGAAAVVLTSCGGVSTSPDPALMLRTEESYIMLVAGREDELYGRFDKDMQTPALRDTIKAMRDAIPPGPAAGPPILSSWEKLASTDGGKSDYKFVYNYPEVPAFLTVEGHYKGSDKKGWVMDGFHVQGKRGVYEGQNLGTGTITPPPVFKTEPADS